MQNFRRTNLGHTSLIIGGSRGIGLGLARNILLRTSGKVIVTSRAISPDLEHLYSQNINRLSFHQMDATDEQNIK